MTVRIVHILKATPWPLHGGRAINAHYQIRAAVERGHDVHVAVIESPDSALLRMWPLSNQVTIHSLNETQVSDCNDDGNDCTPCASSRRWNRYWGNADWIARSVRDVCVKLQPDYVEACGIDVLPWLSALPRRLPTLWLAADDLCLHHLSLVRSATGVSNRINALRNGVAMAMYERAFTEHVDAAVAVSPADARALRALGGFRHVILAPNGVDETYFCPADLPVDPNTAVFWGRLDFKPNIDAINWFVTQCWPGLHQHNQHARFRIVGFNPDDQIRALAGTPSVELIGAVDDIRPWALRSSVVVLPMQSGAGIKNKLLEAAAMGRPIVATARATSGLATNRNAPLPWRKANSPIAMQREITALWDEPAIAKTLGQNARQWVIDHHNWTDGAIQREQFVRSLHKSIHTPQMAA